MGTAIKAPGMPHIQPQKITERNTAMGLIVRRRLRIVGVTR